MIRVVIDHKLRVPIKDIPEDIRPLLLEALSIPNLAKQEAEKMDVWGWRKMPDKIDMWDISEFALVMPRGFLKTFQEGCLMYGHELEILDMRICDTKIFQATPTYGPRPHQIPAVKAILANEHGIYQAPAGSGKTVTILRAIAEAGAKALVIVNTKDILWQWQERSLQHIGVEAGQIGDGIFDIKEVTIATAQTIHSRFKELESQGFFEEFSFVCLDECHHSTADTYSKILDRFSSKWRVGVSATPDKTGDFTLAQLILGPVFHKTEHEDVEGLIRPKVYKVPTKFGFGFKGHVNRFQRSNYGKMIEALVRNHERNDIIIKCIKENKGHHQLVISKRLEHLDLIADMLEDAEFSDPVIRLTGAESNEDRLKAKEIAESQPCVMLSTLAEEALDIPRLDRIHLPFPQKNPGLVTQQIGRVERDHPDKKDAIVYDYYDGKIGPLDSQWRTRRFEVYEPRGFEIKTKKPD